MLLYPELKDNIQFYLETLSIVIYLYNYKAIISKASQFSYLLIYIYEYQHTGCPAKHDSW